MPAIKGELKPGELDIKRLYLPGITLADKCPKCGKEVTYDFEQHCLPSYPEANKVIQFPMYCGDGCEHEWSVPVILKISLQIAQ